MSDNDQSERKVMSGSFLTVEEAARRLGVSSATVKRRARDGLIEAVKSGRNWIIREDALPAQASRRQQRVTGAASALVDFTAALRHIRNQDLNRDAWVPDVLRFADDLRDTSALTDAAAARVDETAPLDPAIRVPVPKSPIFLRNAVNLSLPDRLAYHAVVLAMAPTLDDLIGSEAYAARLDSGHRFIRTGGFARWKAGVRHRADEVGGYVVETDVTAFFDCINHTLLMREIRDAGVPQTLTNVLSHMLRTWAVAPSTGLPQGPDASRLLANFYMRAVDDVMSRIPDVSYYRYMDDVRIIAPTRHLAIRALHEFDDECKKRNLVLSTKKTELRTAADAIAALEDTALEDANYAFDTDDDSADVRKSLSKLFRDALKGDGTVNRTHARFSLYRLYKLREKAVLKKVLDNLETIAQLGWNVAAYIAPWVTTRRVADGVADYLDDPERNTGGYLASWLLAAFADEPSSATPRIVNYARRVAFDLSQASFQRAIAMQVAALGRTPSDVVKLQAIIDKEYDPEVVRAALVALRRIDRLDKATADRAKRLPGMQRTIDYLRSQDDLPSMLFGHLRARRLR
ncbi:reverse transcriptase domain-containing protein [Microbacterium sp. W4I20]|uniref:reverse transcriptase domain-containing protein n=1 Tax=Microbacterium sp. W4I20 TaxID=3042262 RepID=UPI002789164D|nr:reverse transcriptase domain-containing protein [Microbacterium sp. W4I20]MDQ0727046.1 excisionase family DNA binding protein [Microbacterium sp. W4I20]